MRNLCRGLVSTARGMHIDRAEAACISVCHVGFFCRILSGVNNIIMKIMWIRLQCVAVTWNMSTDNTHFNFGIQMSKFLKSQFREFNNVVSQQIN